VSILTSTNTFLTKRKSSGFFGFFDCLFLGSRIFLIVCFWLQALEELEKLLPKRNICIAAKEMLVKDSGVAEESSYDLVVKGIQAAPRAKGHKTNHSIINGSLHTPLKSNLRRPSEDSDDSI